MTQTAGSLPTDTGGQKFAGWVDAADADHVLPRAMGVQTISSRDYGALGVLPTYATDTTHDSDSVTTTAVSQGAAQSTTSAVDARGFNKCSLFIEVSGLTAGTLSVKMIPRFAQTGDDYTPETTVSGALGNGYHMITIDLPCPYFMIEAEASSGTATTTIYLYLHRSD